MPRLPLILLHPLCRLRRRARWPARRGRFAPLLPALLAMGCTQDFGLQSFEPAEAYGEDRPEDEAADPVDTGWTDEDTGEHQEPDPEPEEEEDEPEEPTYDDAPEDDCEDSSDLVYVVDRDDEMVYLFDPDALRFEPLGPLRCPSGGTPGSMAVARDGLAYVRYSDDAVYEVDLTDMSCYPTSYRGAAGFGSFGMGFATEHDGTWRDDLYVADEDSVARLDTSSWQVNVFGGMASQSELTGNSAGELWAILPLETPAELVRIDRDTGAEAEVIRLPTFPDPYDIDTFAFATWGGDFWIFVRSYGMGNSTDVYRVTPDGQMTKPMSDVGFDVVGAGVSTCAPSE